MIPRPVLLLILDGFGYRADAADNAISAALCPHLRRIWQHYPRTLIRTDGLTVGLPEGQMGNSEVGHMNLGAGRVVYQELTRINLALSDQSFFQNAALNQACAAARRNASTLHVIGLLSDGGVHSHEAHLLAMLDLAKARGIEKVAVHAFLDGRDTPPKSARASLERLVAHAQALGNTRVASICGRYYAMDRDQRWERIALCWRTLVDGRAEFTAADPVAALESAYARGENDEFVNATLIGPGAAVLDGDVVVFMNFRADRARQLSQAFVAEDFVGFTRARVPQLAAFVTLTEYSEDLAVSAVAYRPQSMRETLPELLAERGLKQLRIAETEKYAHVTFFFSGGRELAYPGEERILVPSPKVATYDLQPEMSCPELTERLLEAIAGGRFDFIVCNIANLDMVGHTGVFSAAVAAVEAVDVALGKLEQAILIAGGAMLITADHGNIEDMWDAESGQPNTQHSTNPVPLVMIGARGELRNGGALQDVAPTVLQLLGLPQPKAMTGVSLLG